jgi:hypothetical protein
MSVPKFVFLDTNVFAGQSYNFQSAALKTFVAAARAQGDITLLLPDPTQREVRRHIRERSAEALAALNQARRHAPFLAKWEHYPQKSFPAATDWEVTRIANNEWIAFLRQLKVQELGYDGVNPAQVMLWYGEGRPPFGTGKKKHEFPDAFAVAILDGFVAKNSCAVAIVSEDPDMKQACERRTSFLHFSSLPQLTELLVSGTDKVKELREAILHDLTLLDAALTDEVSSNITYYHSYSDYEITDTDLGAVNITDVRIVALGHSVATLAFEAEVETTQHLKWREQEYDDEWVTERAQVLESGTIHGSAKVELDPRTQTISAVAFIELEESELEVTETPYRRYLPYR